MTRRFPMDNRNNYVLREDENSGNIYFTIFRDGFCDPRSVAEFLMSEVRGTYYRMQIQVRQ